MKRLSICIAVIIAELTLLPATVANASWVPTASASNVVDDADWTLSAQLLDGAIAHYVDRVEVSPYLANFAAMGLARAREVTGDHRYSDAAWRWLGWYQAHQDANGFVTDYVVNADGSLTSKRDMDSTDAYAGTFLLAAHRTWKATGNKVRLNSLAAGIAGAVRAIEATQDIDGLTWAKPTWHVKYLMDQSEAYAGLQAAVELAAVLGKPWLQQRAAGNARRMRAGVQQLWNPATGAYDWAVFDTGARQTTNWSVMYPDAQQQVWAVAFGLANGTRAKNLVSKFATAQPRWDQPAAVATYASGSGSVGYWPVTGWAFARVGNVARSLTAAARIRSAAETARRTWPFNTSTAAQLIQLESADSGYLAPLAP